jgi:alkylated DNA repair dioxygenase AlkB
VTQRAGVRPTGFAYIPSVLRDNEQREISSLVRALEFKRDSFRGQLLMRRYAQFGYAYVSTGRKLEGAPPLPDFLSELLVKTLPHCPAGTRFNQCIVTHYPEDAGIGWHPDAPCFGDCIAAVSLGGSARLQFRPNGAREVSFEVLAEPGSLYVMRGEARWEYQHQIVPVKAERYSITFRLVAEEVGK